MTDVAKAIHKINSNASFIVKDNDVNQIEWHNGTTPIPKADIEAKMVELQAEYDANQYQRDRATAYPPIGDQLDMLWHSIDQNPELKQKYFDFYETIKQVKVKYPKNG
jgi:proline dehydrogenase